MSNYSDRPDCPDGTNTVGGPTRSWSIPSAALSSGGVSALGALCWCVLGPSDPAGRLLVGVAGAALAIAALYGVLARPRLVADRLGVRIGGVRGSRDYPWSSVRGVRVAHTRRFGREVSTLELETQHPDADSERLHVFSRLDLGADPREVADVLDALSGRD